MKKLTEESVIKFDKYDELSYYDGDDYFVELYVKNKLVGIIEVWTDYENDNREYIPINHEIVYLDTIRKLER